MARLSLNPAPTFNAPVSIPVPGGEADPIVFTFKYRTRSEALSWGKDAEARELEDPALVAEMVTGWDLDDAFTPENIARLCDVYAGAGKAIFRAYLDELRGVRAKN